MKKRLSSHVQSSSVHTAKEFKEGIEKEYFHIEDADLYGTKEGFEEEEWPLEDKFIMGQEVSILLRPLFDSLSLKLKSH